MTKNFQQIVTEFEKVNLKEPPGTTFLEIVAKSHMENVWSRILAFYLDPNEKHGFKDLLIRSLFYAIPEERTIHTLRSYKVQTEFPTKQGRIDILVKSSDFVLGIENKVNAPLYNDLSDYLDALKSNAFHRDVRLVVLSKNPVDLSDIKNSKEGKIEYEGKVKIQHVSYAIFVKSIRKFIGFYSTNADIKYYVFLLDFIDNIEKNINLMYMLEDQNAMKFFMDNYKEIGKFNQANEQLHQEKIRSLNTILKKLLENKSWLERIHELLKDKFTITTPVFLENGICMTVLYGDQKIVESVLYFEDDYKYCGYIVSMKEFLNVFPVYKENVFEGPEFELSLDPWISLDEVAKNYMNIIGASVELVKNHEKEILAIVQQKLGSTNV